MSDTHELSSPLPPFTPAHAWTDLHSKLSHLNTVEKILLCVCVCVSCSVFNSHPQAFTFLLYFGHLEHLGESRRLYSSAPPCSQEVQVSPS